MKNLIISDNYEITYFFYFFLQDLLFHIDLSLHGDNSQAIFKLQCILTWTKFLGKNVC